MIPRAVHRSPGNYLTAEEYLSYETIDEGCVTSHRFKWNPLSPNEVGPPCWIIDFYSVRVFVKELIYDELIIKLKRLLMFVTTLLHGG